MPCAFVLIFIDENMSQPASARVPGVAVRHGRAVRVPARISVIASYIKHGLCLKIDSTDGCVPAVSSGGVYYFFFLFFFLFFLPPPPPPDAVAAGAACDCA